ncbi:MAG: hypothetical protein ACLS4S_03685 [Bacteroides nordii]
MKYFKIISVLLGIFLFISCSKDDQEHFQESEACIITINVTGSDIPSHMQGDYTATFTSPTLGENAVYRLLNNEAYIQPIEFPNITYKFYIYDSRGQVIGASQTVPSSNPMVVGELIFMSYSDPSKIIGHGYANRKSLNQEQI